MVIGAGAVGLLTAFYFQKAQIDVTVVARRKVQAEKINREGIKLLSGDHQESVYPKAVPAEEIKSAEAEAAFVALKQTEFSSWVLWAKSHLDVTLPLVLLQNGEGHTEKLRDAGFTELIRAIVTHGAMRESDTAVRHTGKGKMTAEDTSIMHLLGKPFFKHADFPIQLSKNIKAEAERKFIVNVTVNPVTAVYGVRNGELLANESLLDKAYQLFTEAAGVLCLDESYWRDVLNVLDITADNCSSMLVDIQVGRRTEADALTGYVIAEAEKQKIAVPHTIEIHNQLKQLERRERID
ncbi:ketopantoate reductase [Salisediminibacterium halotolerans]|nr:ketopantoate reductase [Salisediminibacterium halotolerans]